MSNEETRHKISLTATAPDIFLNVLDLIYTPQKIYYGLTVRLEMEINYMQRLNTILPLGIGTENGMNLTWHHLCHIGFLHVTHAGPTLCHRASCEDSSKSQPPSL